MSGQGYLVAAYATAVAAYGGYALRLVIRRKALRIKASRLRPAAGGRGGHG